MKRLRIEHQTGFSYQGDVSASYNEARMLPSSTDSQFVLSSALDIEPSTSVNQYVDYFGTRVGRIRRALAARRAEHHRPLARRGAPAADRACRHLVGPAAHRGAPLDRDGRAARPDHPHAAASRGRRARADDRGSARSPGPRCATTIAIADRRCRRVHARHHGRALDRRRGVGGPQGRLPGHRPHHPRRAARGRHPGALRVGILAPASRARTWARPVTGESHAWVEWFAGEWQGFDPTNNIEIGDRHVLVGRGPRLQRCPPLRGVYAGPFKSQLHVKVTITREA